jgi:hypothetical protein
MLQISKAWFAGVAALSSVLPFLRCGDAGRPKAVAPTGGDAGRDEHDLLLLCAGIDGRPSLGAKSHSSEDWINCPALNPRSCRAIHRPGA